MDNCELVMVFVNAFLSVIYRLESSFTSNFMESNVSHLLQL